MDKGKKIDIEMLHEQLSGDPTKKRTIRETLGVDRRTMSNILKGKRHIYAGELLTIADILGVPAEQLAA